MRKSPDPVREFDGISSGHQVAIQGKSRYPAHKRTPLDLNLRKTYGLTRVIGFLERKNLAWGLTN
jgi:hypothetical protein